MFGQRAYLCMQFNVHALQPVLDFCKFVLHFMLVFCFAPQVCLLQSQSMFSISAVGTSVMFAFRVLRVCSVKLVLLIPEQNCV